MCGPFVWIKAKVPTGMSLGDLRRESRYPNAWLVENATLNAEYHAEQRLDSFQLKDGVEYMLMTEKPGNPEFLLLFFHLMENN